MCLQSQSLHMIYLVFPRQRQLEGCLNLVFFLSFLLCRLLQLLSETDRMWMTNIVVLCLLGLVASAEDKKKLSSHATTLADNSANLAFRSVSVHLSCGDTICLIIFSVICLLKNKTQITDLSCVFDVASTTTWPRRKAQRTFSSLLWWWPPLWGW